MKLDFLLLLLEGVLVGVGELSLPGRGLLPLGWSDAELDGHVPFPGSCGWSHRSPWDVSKQLLEVHQSLVSF